MDVSSLRKVDTRLELSLDTLREEKKTNRKIETGEELFLYKGGSKAKLKQPEKSCKPTLRNVLRHITKDPKNLAPRAECVYIHIQQKSTNREVWY